MLESKYKFVVIDGKTTYEHILVAEQMLGRKLRGGECVHHIDHNKQHNTPDNLMVFASLADHARFHAGGESYKYGDVWKARTPTRYCKFCGKQFTPRYHTQTLCSDECVKNDRIANHTKSHTSIEDIITALKTANGNFLAVSRMIGITSSAIHKRLLKAGLPHHSKDYRNKQ